MAEERLREEEEIAALEVVDDDSDEPNQQGAGTGARKRRQRSGTPERKRRIRGELNKDEKEHSKKVFRDAWLEADEFKGWLAKVKDDPKKAYCKLCNTLLAAGKSELQKHAAGIKHKDKMKGVKNMKPLNEIFNPARMTKEQKLAEDTKKAEILLGAFFAEHNLELQASDHLIPLMKKAIPDSEIMIKVTLDRTKNTAILQNVIANTEKEEIIEDLKKVKFSALVDESSDVANLKNMVVLVKYVCPKTGLVKTPMLEMVQLDAKDCSAEAMWEKFKNCFELKDIPLMNIVGLACDHAPVMVGVNNSFWTRLKAAVPHAILLDCVCHTTHIAASAACRKLPALATGTIRLLSTYTSGSPKRSAVFQEFQEFYQTQTLKLLRPAATRWLVMHQCVDRLLDQWTPLKQYIQYCSLEDPHDQEAAQLLQDLNNPFFKAYILFLKYSLEYFNQLNALFQSEKTLVHKLQSSSMRLLKQVCQNYMRENILESIATIDVAHPHFQVPLKRVYLGPGVEDVIAAIPVPADPMRTMTEEQLRKMRANDIKTFRLKCQEFYITAAQELKKYLPLNNEMLREATFVAPKIVVSKAVRQETLMDLPALVGNFKDCLGIDPYMLSRESRNMPYDIDTPAERREQISKLEPEEFWVEVATMKDFKEDPIFPNLVKLAHCVLAFPHANADAEKAFSDVVDIKTKKRNRMGENTLDAICVSRTAMRQKKCYCFQYEVTDKHLSKHNKTMYPHHNK